MTITIKYNPKRAADRPFVLIDEQKRSDGTPYTTKREPLSASRVMTLLARYEITVTDADLSDVADGNPLTIEK